MAYGYHRGPAEGSAADDWARNTATRMLADNYTHDSILRYLEAYGLSFFAAQALVRELTNKQ